MDAFYAKALRLPTVIDLLRPYGGETDICKCPLDVMDPNLLEENPFLKHPHQPTWFQEVGSSYDYDDVSALSGLFLSGYPSSSSSVVVCDLGSVHGPLDQNSVGRKNLLFADMHVKLDTENQWATYFVPAGPNSR